MPPVWLVAQQGVAIMQSSMQFVGHAQQAFLQPHEGVMHGFMHGSMQDIGQSAIFCDGSGPRRSRAAPQTTAD